MGVDFYDGGYDVEKGLGKSDEYRGVRGVYDEVNGDEWGKGMFDKLGNVEVEVEEKEM